MTVVEHLLRRRKEAGGGVGIIRITVFKDDQEGRSLGTSSVEGVSKQATAGG